jgi:hypothetical protein
LSLFTFVALAQSERASISGEITDTGGAVVASAKVFATNTETNVVTTAETNTSGIYVIANLEPGSYSVSIEHPGFRRYHQTGIVLQTAETYGLNAKLEVGTVNETVTVVAYGAALEDKTSVITQTFEPEQVADLPLGDRRSMNLVNLAAGAVFVDYTTGGKPNFSLSGGRTQSQMVWLDGGSTQNMRLGVGQLDTDPPAEAVQEVKILSNSYSAEYGASAGGVVIQTTKSGTNKFQGSAYEFLRNDAFDAPGFFAPIDPVSHLKTIPKLRYNVYGATLGGPIRKNRTFFFFSYEGRNLRVGSTTTLSVPTLLQRKGDFSDTRNAAGNVIAIYDPSTTVTTGTTSRRTAFPGNIIPTSQLDPVALKVLDYYPSPNRTPDSITGNNNFRANSIAVTDSGFYMGKVDHIFSEKDRMTGRYMYNADLGSSEGPYPLSDVADPTSTIDASQKYAFVSEIHVLNPATINEFRFNYGYRIAHARTNGVGKDIVPALGLNGVDNNAFPRFAPAGIAAIGATAQERRQYPIKNIQFVESLSKIVGKHSLKFGIEFRKSVNYETNLSTASGSFTFATTPTGQPGSAGTGNGTASMLMGFPTAFSQTRTDITDRHSWYEAAFIQDDYTIARNLTLNIGLRWEMDTPMSDLNNRMNGFDLRQINPVSGTPGVVKFMGQDGFRTSPWDTDWNNFGPRFGFAWKPGFSNRVVVRGGYAVQFAHPFDAGQPASANLGWGINSSYSTPDNGLTAPFYLRNGVPNTFVSPVRNDSYGAVRVGQATSTAVTYFDPSRRTGYSQQSNVSVQYQLSSSTIVEVTALSNNGHKLANVNLSINQILPSVLGPGHSSQSDRPYPQFNDVQILSPSIGDSRYIAGFVRISKRFTKGLNLNASYTRATFLDNTFEGGTSVGADGNPLTYLNYYNRRADWGPSKNDVRHRMTFSSVYELPFGPGKRWMSRGIAGTIAGGWTFGTVATAQSGAPFTVTTTTDTSNSFSAGGTQRADVLRDPVLPSDQRSVSKWFDTSAFAQPALYTFGNSGRDSMRAPGIVSVDLSILRNFRLTERSTLQFRGESLNAINHTNLSSPVAALGNGSFGQINTSRPARVMQIGMKVRF